MKNKNVSCFSDGAPRAKRILVVIVGDYMVTGVVAFLEERLPRLIERCGCRITLFVPGRVLDQAKAGRMASAGVDIIEGRISLDNPLERRLGLKRQLRAIIEEGEFDVVHVNTASRLVNTIALSSARRFGVPVRISHSHNSNRTLSTTARMMELYYQLRVVGAGTDFLACSDEAGEFMIGKHAWRRRGVIVPNGIDVERYAFSPERRRAIRAELGIGSEARVFGFVGRVSDQKNPLFLVRTFNEIAKKDPSAVFLIVGDGPLMHESRDLAETSGHVERIHFLGNRDDVPVLLQGMDALILPSKFEGFLITLLEGECSGLPCFVSDAVTRASRIDGCPVCYLPLDAGPAAWADAILDSDLTRNERGSEYVTENGFDIDKSVTSLVKYYS